MIFIHSFSSRGGNRKGTCGLLLFGYYGMGSIYTLLLYPFAGHSNTKEGKEALSRMRSTSICPEYHVFGSAQHRFQALGDTGCVSIEVMASCVVLSLTIKTC